MVLFLCLPTFKNVDSVRWNVGGSAAQWLGRLPCDRGCLVQDMFWPLIDRNSSDMFWPLIDRNSSGAPNKPFFQNKPKISRSEGYIDCKKNQWPSEQKYFSKKMWEHEHTEKKLPAQQKSFSQQLPITSFSSQHIKHTCGTPPLGAPDSCYS